MAVLLGMLAGALLVLAAALASIWVQQRNATHAEHATADQRSTRCPGDRKAGTAGTRPGPTHHQRVRPH
jgi:hypothetical protein